MTRILIGIAATAIAVVSLATTASSRSAVAVPATDALLTRAGFPAPETAKSVLSAALMRRHPQYLDVRTGSTSVRSFVVFPDGGEQAPVVVLTAGNQGMTDWLRAVG